MNTILANNYTYDAADDYDIFHRGPWVLEVVKFITEPEGEVSWVKEQLYKIEGMNFGSSNQTPEEQENHSKKMGQFKHIGYMRITFKTKKKACAYYNMHNPHLRPLNANNNDSSDWDPETKLLYIVRKNYRIFPTIEAWGI